jgi:hypothetical protein
MPALMMAPVGMGVARSAMRANDARAIRGHHRAAAWSSDKTGVGGGIIVIGIIIIIRVVVVIDAADEHPVEAMPVTKPMPGKSRTPCNDGGSGAVRTAANGGATVTATTAITAAMAASAAAVSAAHFNRQFFGGSLARSCTSRIDRRQRFCARAGDNR